MTQMDLTLAIGLRQPVSVSRYETGGYLPDPPMLACLIDVLDLDADATWELWGLSHAERARQRVESAPLVTSRPSAEPSR
jgi:hypothetical protein